jgi:hypothetical protein
MTVDKMTVDKMTVDKMTVDKMTQILCYVEKSYQGQNTLAYLFEASLAKKKKFYVIFTSLQPTRC